MSDIGSPPPRWTFDLEHDLAEAIRAVEDKLLERTPKMLRPKPMQDQEVLSLARPFMVAIAAAIAAHGVDSVTAYKRGLKVPS